MAINIYKTRTMMGAIEKIMPVNTFLLTTFFNNVDTVPTETVDFDFKKGKRKMAPFVAPRVGGITIDRQGFLTKSITPPRIAPQRVLTKDDISSRAMGENVYSTLTPDQRVANILMKDLADLDDMITRREEWMCREILFTGKCVMKGFIDDVGSNTIDQEVDYGFTNKETLTGVAKWDQATADIYGDFRRWRLTIIQKTGKAPSMATISGDAYLQMLKNVTFMGLFDKKDIKIGGIEPSVVNDAVTFIGKIISLNLELYTYDDWFVDDAGVEQPIIPVKTVLMGKPGMAKRIYGAVTQMEDDEEFHTYEGTRIPKKWADKINEVKMLKVSSRPVPMPEDVDDWYVATVY